MPVVAGLFERLGGSHEIHAFALKHLARPQSYSLLGFTVHDLGRPSASPGLTRWAQERALAARSSSAGPFDSSTASMRIPRASWQRELGGDCGFHAS